MVAAMIAGFCIMVNTRSFTLSCATYFGLISLGYFMMFVKEGMEELVKKTDQEE